MLLLIWDVFVCWSASGCFVFRPNRRRVFQEPDGPGRCLYRQRQAAGDDVALAGARALRAATSTSFWMISHGSSPLGQIPGVGDFAAVPPQLLLHLPP